MTGLAEAIESGKPCRKYDREVAVGGLVLHLVPLEEHHWRQMANFEDRLDADTVYLRYGSCLPAETRKSTVWLERQWNKDGEDGFSEGAFLNGRLIGIGSMYKSPGGKSAEGALTVAPDFQGLGRNGAKGVGGYCWKS